MASVTRSASRKAKEDENSMASVTRSASQKTKDDKKSKLSAKHNGGKSKRGKMSVYSSPTMANTNRRRSSTRGSSLLKQDSLSPSPSSRKSERLVNRILTKSPSKKTPVSKKKRSMPSPVFKLEKDRKQHSSTSANARRSEKRSCSSGSKKSGKMTTSKSNNVEGNEQMRLKKRARSMPEIGKKVEEMEAADSGEQARKKRLDDRNNRKFLMAQVTTVRSPGNSRFPEGEVEVLESDETRHLEVIKGAMDGGNVSEEEDLKERDPAPSRGEEDIELSGCLDIETANGRNCPENVCEPEKEMCPPSNCTIPLPCSSAGLDVEEEDVKEAQGVEDIEMTQVAALAKRALPDAGPTISGASSEMIVGCSTPETKDASNNNVQVHLANESDGDEEYLECLDPVRMSPPPTEQHAVCMAVPLPSNSGSTRTNDPDTSQTDVLSSSQQDDGPVRPTFTGPTAQFSLLEPAGGSQVPLMTTAADAMKNGYMIATGMPQLFSADPLQNEMEKILRQKELSTKMTDCEMKRLSTEQAREIEEVSKKYDAFVQAADVRLQQTHKLLDTNCKKVCLNRLLAEAYKYRCRNLMPPSKAVEGMAAQQGWQTLQPCMPHLQTAYTPNSGRISGEAAPSSVSATQLSMQMEGRSTSTAPDL